MLHPLFVLVIICSHLSYGHKTSVWDTERLRAHVWSDEEQNGTREGMKIQKHRTPLDCCLLFQKHPAVVWFTCTPLELPDQSVVSRVHHPVSLQFASCFGVIAQKGSVPPPARSPAMFIGVLSTFMVRNRTRHWGENNNIFSLAGIRTPDLPSKKMLVWSV